MNALLPHLEKLKFRDNSLESRSLNANNFYILKIPLMIKFFAGESLPLEEKEKSSEVKPKM